MIFTFQKRSLKQMAKNTHSKTEYMDATLKLAGHILKFIIDKSMNMKSAENKTKTGESTTGESHSVSKAIGTLAAGAAVGLAAGILLAPAKGKKTRAKLAGEAKDFADRLKKKAGDVISTANSAKK